MFFDSESTRRLYYTILYSFCWCTEISYCFMSYCLLIGIHIEQHLLHKMFLLLLLLLLLSRFSRVQLCATPQTAVHQAPPSPGFSRQEHWSGLPLPSPMHESEKWKWSLSVMSDSWRPHGLQPTWLLHPWDSPGKSTGVGCHRLLWKRSWGNTITSTLLLKQ